MIARQEHKEKAKQIKKTEEKRKSKIGQKKIK